MAKYTGPKCKICRRDGHKLFLKGSRCFTDKCALERKKYAPGEHGKRYRRRLSEYGIRLREKQKAKNIYGILEKQFRKTFEQASSASQATDEVFFQLLESRLDNIIYRFGLASSRSQARQLVCHGHVEVNNQKVTIPSYQVQEQDVIALDFVPADLDKKAKVPSWLKINAAKKGGEVLRLPTFKDQDTNINFQYIIEFYSR